MEKKTLCDLELNGKKALVRVDYNVPMDAGGNITDDTRITASLDTLRYLLEHGAAVILMAHLGRPKGEVNKKYSLEPVAAYCLICLLPLRMTALAKKQKKWQRL